MTLKEELASVEADIQRLELRKRELYQLSTEAPENEKICENHFAQMLAEPTLFTSIRYPIEISGITFTGGRILADGYGGRRRLVRIRPCAKEFGGKTFLGLYLGDFAQTVGCSFNRETGVLEVILSHHNPAIWIPSIERIIFGFESWWGPLESEEQLRSIVDLDISNVWYVQAMQTLQRGERSDAKG